MSFRVKFVCCFFLAAVFLPGGSNVCAEKGEAIFTFRVEDTSEFEGRFTVAAGEEITVDWGDGTRDIFEAGRQVFSKDYEKPTDTEIRIYAQREAVLMGFSTGRHGKISFDLGDIPVQVVHMDIRSDNSITGDVSDMPRGMTFFRGLGSNTITGDLSNLPRWLERLEIRGNNTLSGNIRNLPPVMTWLECYGENTIKGDMKDAPEGLIRFQVMGSNRINGDIGSLPNKLEHFRLVGGGKFTGKLSDLPDGLIGLYIHGANTITGNLKALPAEITRFEVFGGKNTIDGNLAEIPAGIQRFRVEGENTISDYTGGREWAENMIQVTLLPADGYGLSTEEVDSLLIDLAATTWRAWKILDISGTNAPRSDASGDAVASLEERGVRVTTN